MVYEPHIKQAVDRVNRLPGIRIFGFYSLGAHPGQVRLNLHVMRETAFNGSVRADNYGVSDTGTHRILATLSRYNVSQRGDTLSARLLATEEDGNLYGGINYRLPLLNDRDAVTTGLYRNQFQVAGDFADLELEGELSGISLGLERRILQEIHAKSRLQLALGLKRSRIRSAIFSDIFASTTEYATAAAALVVELNTGASRQQIAAGINAGSISQRTDESIDSRFFYN